jgi:hypothetical protein
LCARHVAYDPAFREHVCRRDGNRSLLISDYPIGVPVVFLGLHIAVSILQAYIFVLLTTIYLQEAVGEET